MSKASDLMAPAARKLAPRCREPRAEPALARLSCRPSSVRSPDLVTRSTPGAGRGAHLWHAPGDTTDNPGLPSASQPTVSLRERPRSAIEGCIPSMMQAVWCRAVGEHDRVDAGYGG